MKPIAQQSSLILALLLSLTAYAGNGQIGSAGDTFSQKCNVNTGDGNGYNIDVNGKEAVVAYGSLKGGSTGSMIHLNLKNDSDAAKATYISDDLTMRLLVTKRSPHSDPTLSLSEVNRSEPIFDFSGCRAWDDPKPLNSLLRDDETIRNFIYSALGKDDNEVFCLLVDELTALDPATKNFQARFSCATRIGNNSYGHVNVSGQVFTRPSFKKDQNLSIKKLELIVGN